MTASTCPHDANCPRLWWQGDSHKQPIFFDLFEVFSYQIHQALDRRLLPGAAGARHQVHAAAAAGRDNKLGLPPDGLPMPAEPGSAVGWCQVFRD